MILYVLIASFLFQTNIESEVVRQARVYVHEIENGINLSENYWAISELYFSNCNRNQSVRQIALNSKSSSLKKYFGRQFCSSSGDSISIQKNSLLKQISLSEGLIGLAFFAILNDSDQNSRVVFFDDFYQAWGNDVTEKDSEFFYSIIYRNSIDSQSIPPENFELVLYGIFYSYSYQELFTNLDLLEYASDLKGIFSQNYHNDSLQKDIQFANIIFLYFINQEYRELTKLHDLHMKSAFFPISREKLRHTKALAYSHFSIGRFDRSLELNRNILETISEYIDDEIEIDEARYFQALYFLRLGKFQSARDIFEDFYGSSNTNIDRAILLNDLSVSYYHLGETHKYLVLLLDALSEAENTNDYDIKLIIINNLFNYYTSIGDDNSALDYLNLAEETASSLDDNYQIASIHAFKSVFLWQTDKDLDDSIKEIELAIEGFDRESNFFDYISALQFLAKIYLDSDSLDKAMPVFQTILEESLSRSDNEKYIQGLIGLTQIAVKKGDIELANNYLLEIQGYSLVNLNFATTVKFHSVKAQVLLLSGRTRESYAEIEPVIDQVIERAKTSIDSQTGYWVQTSEYIEVFELTVEMLISMKETKAAVQLLDNYKTINDAALYNSPILRANRLSEQDLARDNLLNSQILSLRTQYLNENLDSERLKLKSQIDQLSAERDEIFSKIRSESPSNEINIWNIQRSLKTNEQIIHLTEIGNFLYVSSLTRNDVSIDVIEFGRGIKQEFERIANDLASSKTNLNDLFWLQEFLGIKSNIEENISSLIVIPDNFLYRIPLDILPLENPRTNNSYGSMTYLLEKYEVSYFTSLNELQNNQRPSRSSNSNFFSAFAISDFQNFQTSSLPSLPFATLEIQNIDASLTEFDQKNLFVESQATKESFLSNAASSSVIHVATHSEVSEQDPLFSKIYLNSLQESDGPEDALYAYELFDANLSNDFIMLNSCSSGSGEYLQGTGIMGISRALRYAGASSLALNLWSVNDKLASDFATEFYKSINDGYSKSEAMRQAKLALLESENANPHYWGAYMLIGNPSPLTEKPARAGFLFPFMIIIIGSISIFIRNY